MPSKKQNKLNFTAVHVQHHKSYIIYANLESLLSPVSTTIQDPQTSYTAQTAHLTPCGYIYIMIGPDEPAPIQVY